MRGDPIPSSLTGRAAILYGLLAAVSVAWNVVRGRGIPLYDGSLAASIGLGLLCAALTLGLAFAAYAVIPAMRKLAEEMAGLLIRGSSPASLAALAALSGVGEEMFFRGAVQAEFGVVVASVVFGLAHVGPSRIYLLWTAWALAAGFLFGGLYILTGGVLAPVVAHTVHNGVTLFLWRRRMVVG